MIFKLLITPHSSSFEAQDEAKLSLMDWEWEFK
jgi:hypothetical protein